MNCENQTEIVTQKKKPSKKYNKNITMAQISCLDGKVESGIKMKKQSVTNRE